MLTGGQADAAGVDPLDTDIDPLLNALTPQRCFDYGAGVLAHIGSNKRQAVNQYYPQGHVCRWQATHFGEPARQFSRDFEAGQAGANDDRRELTARVAGCTQLANVLVQTHCGFIGVYIESMLRQPLYRWSNEFATKCEHKAIVAEPPSATRRPYTDTLAPNIDCLNFPDDPINPNRGQNVAERNAYVAQIGLVIPYPDVVIGRAVHYGDVDVMSIAELVQLADSPYCTP